MLNSAFDEWGNAELDLYPTELHAEIEKINAPIYDTVNNGIYDTYQTTLLLEPRQY